MKNPNIKLLLLFCLTFSMFVYSQEKGVGNPTITKLPSKEKRFALIIGVDTYQKDISPLYGTVNDARALREVLIKYAGFADERIILMTTDLTDADLIPTRGNIIDQLDKLQRIVPADGLILFSFSGHGVSIGNDAFIVPSDGRIYQDAELMRERAIDVLRIKRAIQATKVKQVIMFLDACRNDPVRAKGGVDNDLTPAYASGFSFEIKNQNIEAYATLYATSFGDRAYEFYDKKTNKYRGYFSYAIEEGLKGAAANEKGEVTLAGLIRYIEDTVKERVRINENRKQIPHPTTEGFRNSDLVIAVVEKNIPIITNSNSVATNSGRIKEAENFYNLALECATTDYDCKIFNYSKAINLNPNYAFAYYWRGFSYIDKQDYDAAIRDYTKSIELNPNYEPAYNDRGFCYNYRRDYDAAIRDLNKAIELNPKYEKAYNNRGISYKGKRNYNAAIRDYTKAIELNPNYKYAYYNRGNAYKDIEDYDAALRDYDKYIQLSPNDPDVYYNRANVYDLIGETAKAKADRRKYKELGGQ